MMRLPPLHLRCDWPNQVRYHISNLTISFWLSSLSGVIEIRQTKTQLTSQYARASIRDRDAEDEEDYRDDE